MPSQRPAPARPPKANSAARKRDRLTAPAEGQREAWRPGQASPKAVLSLQRRYGNRATQKLIQPKLKVGPAADPLERQADTVAEQATAARPALGAAGTLPASAAAVTRGGLRLVQRRSALVAANTTTRKFKGPRSEKGKLDQDVEAVEKSPKGQSFARLETIDLYDARQSHITDNAGMVAWFRIKSGKGAGEFIRGSKVIGGLEAGEQAPPEQAGKGQEMSGLDLGNQAVSGVDASLIEIYRGATMENPSDRTKSLSAITNSNPAQARIEFAEAGTWMASGIFGMATSLRDLKDKDKSGYDKLLASIGLLAGAASIAGGVSQAVQYAHWDPSATTQSSTYTESAKSGGFLVGFGDMFNALTNGLKTIKSIVDLVKMVVDNKTYDTAQGVKNGTDILSNGLQTANSVVRTVRGFNEVLHHGQTATSQFGSVLPGLDIAIAAIGIIQNGYYLVVSAIEMRKMYARKKELEKELTGEKHRLAKEDVKAAGKRYRTEEAQEATTDQLISSAQAEHTQVTQQIAKQPSEWRLVARYENWRKPKLVAKQQALLAEIALLRQKQQEQSARKGNGAFGQFGGETADALRERELASNTHIANKRRVTRQAVHIGTRLVQIGGAIATFVAGPGAPAAMALKLSAMGIDSSLPFWRWLKEKGRDQAAQNRAKGETGLTNKIFNADKAKAAKSRSRHKDAVLILQMVGGLSNHFPTAADRDEEARKQKLANLRQQARRVEGYIRATGCAPQKLYAANGNPTEQVKILVEELSKREL